HGVHDEKRVWFEVELQEAQGDREAEVFQVSNDDTVVAQRRLKDKQPEAKTNTDCLVKEQEKEYQTGWKIKTGDCDVEKNGKWSCIYAVGSQEYQMVCTRLDIASIDVCMLDKFDRGLQTDVQARSTTEAGYMTFTDAWKKEIWLKRLLIESRYELRLVAGIATGCLDEGGIWTQVTTLLGVAECCHRVLVGNYYLPLVSIKGGLVPCRPLLELLCEVASQRAFSYMTSFVAMLRVASGQGVHYGLWLALFCWEFYEIMFTLYEVMTVVTTTGSSDGMKVYHGMLRDGTHYQGVGNHFFCFEQVIQLALVDCFLNFFLEFSARGCAMLVVVVKPVELPFVLSVAA
nr:zinc finger, CCHC-type [Tanacetum cinerariifolium]